MTRLVNKEEFKEMVQEMVNEHRISNEEAIQETIKQLRDQGVPMASILNCVGLDLLPPEDVVPIEKTISQLDEIEEGKDTKDVVLQELKVLIETCDKSVSHKIFIGRSGFVKIALTLLHRFSDDKDIVYTALKALLTVTTDQPDTLTHTRAALIMAEYLEKETDKECLSSLLKLMKISCLQNEANRQSIVEIGCIPRLSNLLETFPSDPSIIQGVCSVFRALVLDDDRRVEFAHHLEHARKIAEKALIILTKLLKLYKTDKEIVGEILHTLSSVITRNEFCEELLEFQNGESLKYILDVFNDFPDTEKLVRQAMKLLQALAGNDRVRREIIKAGAAPLIVSCMFRYKSSSNVSTFGNACISALTLRNEENSKALGEVDAPLAIMESMRTHRSNVNVLKQGCRAIRNMVSRCRDLRPAFLELDAEEMINYILEEFPSQCDFDARSALRYLGCKVEYKDNWFTAGCGEGSKNPDFFC